MLYCLCGVARVDTLEVKLVTLDESADFALRGGFLDLKLPCRVVKLASMVSRSRVCECTAARSVDSVLELGCCKDSS